MTTTIAAPRARTALVLAGGWMHPPDEPVAAVERLLETRDFDVMVVTQPDDVAEAAPGCDLLVVCACWFAMTADRYSDEQRRDWAVVRDLERERALLELADVGTPVLALHTAVICFDGLEEWGAWLGGRWDWTTSSHPPPGPVDVVPEAGAPVVIEPFSVVDEEYQGLVIDPESDVIARSGSGNPLMWLREDGGRRAAVNLLGHDRRSLDEPGHRVAAERLLDWLLRDVEAQPGDKLQAPDDSR